MSKTLWRRGLRVFVDTSAYYALVDRGDAAWAGADQLRGLLARHADNSSSTTMVRPTTSDEDRARSILHDYADKDFSLTDATSFAVMERLGLDAAFTFDHHFAQYGVQVLAQ